jgi:hypothetical protein
MRVGSVIAFLAIAPLLAGAAQPVRLQPSSPWIVNYADESCRLVRTFGQGNQKTVLEFESEAPGQMDLLVVGRPLERDDGSDKVRGIFLPVGGKPLEGEGATSSESGAPAILWSKIPLLPDSLADTLERQAMNTARLARSGARPPAKDLAQAKAVQAARHEFASKATELEVGSRRPVILETGPLGDAIKVFDQCGRDSLRDWGVDPDIEDKIVRPVWAKDVSGWFSANDYPPQMLRAGQQSEVKVRLLVDAAGRPTKCTSLTHFKVVDFNQVVCDKFMKRARFEPAELADGTKVPSYYVNRVKFRMAE